MSLHPRMIGLGGVLGVAFLFVASTAAQDKQRRDSDARAAPTPVRVQPADAVTTANAEDTDQKKVRLVQNAPMQRTPAAGRPAERRWPRVTVRDLWVLQGFHALDDERETFNRFFRFRGRLLDQGFPGDGYYHYGYSPYRSFARDYVSISEYERYRHQRDRHRREMEVRKVRLLTQHEKALHAGLGRLKDGEIERAVVALTLAAKLNQADPACRIHLAQARLAQGHYLEAALALRRALQLQPKLVYADLHLAQCYRDEQALGEYTDKLVEWVRNNGVRPEVYFLLGFLEFQRGDFDAAYAAFERVREALPNDDLTDEYLGITKPAPGQE
jgi:tetratricopeptide (TPR) repeat protein